MGGEGRVCGGVAIIRLTTSSRWRALSSSMSESAANGGLHLMSIMPRLIAEVLPKGEWAAAKSLNQALLQLKMTTDEFASAVLLCRLTRTIPSQVGFPPTDEEMLMIQWPFIAARVGALCLYDFYMGTQAINKSLLGRCPSIIPMIDDAAKRKAQATFEKKFPEFGLARQAAAHPGEINATPEKFQANLVSGPQESFPVILDEGATAYVRGFHGDRYIVTMKGSHVGYDVTDASVANLNEVLGHWRDAFTPVETKLIEMFRQ